MGEEQRIEQLLQQISDNEKYRGCVFEGPGIYFVVVNGEVLTISDDASCSPRGGWFPAIVTGPNEEEEAYLQAKMFELNFGSEFFSEALEDCDPEDVEYFFEENEDEESLEIFRKLSAEVASGKTPFETMEALISKLTCFELDSDLYYVWEGEFIHFYDNICDTGEAPGYFDSIDNATWIRILENIDSYIVTAD